MRSLSRMTKKELLEEIGRLRHFYQKPFKLVISVDEELKLHDTPGFIHASCYVDRPIAQGEFGMDRHYRYRLPSRRDKL